MAPRLSVDVPARLELCPPRFAAYSYRNCWRVYHSLLRCRARAQRARRPVRLRVRVLIHRDERGLGWMTSPVSEKMWSSEGAVSVSWEVDRRSRTDRRARQTCGVSWRTTTTASRLGGRDIVALAPPRADGGTATWAYVTTVDIIKRHRGGDVYQMPYTTQDLHSLHCS